MIWRFKRQADREQELMDAWVDLLQHITDEVAACEGVEALQRMRRMAKILRADADREARADS